MIVVYVALISTLFGILVVLPVVPDMSSAAFCSLYADILAVHNSLVPVPTFCSFDHGVARAEGIEINTGLPVNTRETVVVGG